MAARVSPSWQQYNSCAPPLEMQWDEISAEDIPWQTPCAESGIPTIQHYLHCFILIASPQWDQCQQSLAILNHDCQVLLLFTNQTAQQLWLNLGIKIDTLVGKLRLLALKQYRLQTLSWQTVQTDMHNKDIIIPSPLPKKEFTWDTSGYWGCGGWCAHAWLPQRKSWLQLNYALPGSKADGVTRWYATVTTKWYVVACLHPHKSHIMHLIWCLGKCWDFYVCAFHIDTKSNH